MKISEKKHATSLVKNKKQNNIQSSYQIIPFEELVEYSMESCDLCHSIFHNKLDKYIHNAEHMRIPLIKAFELDVCNTKSASINTLDKPKVDMCHSNVQVDVKTVRGNTNSTINKLSERKDEKCHNLQMNAKSENRPSNCVIIGSNSSNSSMNMGADESYLKLGLKMETNNCTISDDNSHISMLRSEILKDICLKRPIVSCDNIIPLILNQGEIKDTQVKEGPVKIELKDMFSKKLVVNCTDDVVTKIITSTIKVNKSSKETVKDTVKDTVKEFNPVISKVVTKKEKEIISEAKNFLKYSNDEIVISDSDSEGLSLCDNKLKAFNKRIDTDEVTITKLSFEEFVALNESVMQEIAEVDNVPEIDSDYDNDDNEETKDVAVNVLEVDSEYSNDYNGDNGDFSNDYDFKMDVSDDFVKRETVSESLKEFIKCEMESEGFEEFFKTDGGFSESLKSRIIFEDDPDDMLFNNDLIMPDENYMKMPDTNNIKIPKTKPKEKVDVPEGNYESVHYSDLKIEERVRCKYCSKQFPTMYDLCTHEITHMKFRKRPWATPICPICNIYIAGNYRVLTSHVLREHPRKHIRKQEKHKCNECGLTYYHYGAHSMHYHKRRPCHGCKQIFWDKAKFETHECCQRQNKTVPSSLKPPETASESAAIVIKYDKMKDYHFKMCEVCAMFQCNRIYRYMCVGSLCEVGKTFQCDKCNKHFFEVKKYTRRKISFGSRKVHKWKTQGTNMDRLKNIWRKLKKMKK